MSGAEPIKPYRLTFEQRPGYLYAYVEGEQDSYEISRAYWQEIADEAARLSALRVLIDENIPVAVSLTDVFHLAAQIPEMGFGAARIAFVDRYVEQNAINKFGELVAVNRGVNGRIFNDLGLAEKYLAEVKFPHEI
jgi:hypothetical protein